MVKNDPLVKTEKPTMDQCMYMRIHSFFFKENQRCTHRQGYVDEIGLFSYSASIYWVPTTCRHWGFSVIDKTEKQITNKTYKTHDFWAHGAFCGGDRYHKSKPKGMIIMTLIDWPHNQLRTLKCILLHDSHATLWDDESPSFTAEYVYPSSQN